jgi:hypothetical protein
MFTPQQFVSRLKSDSRPKSIIAQELGVTRQVVYLWISGKSRPSGPVLVLAELLWGLPVDQPAGLPVSCPKEGSGEG